MARQTSQGTRVIYQFCQPANLFGPDLVLAERRVRVQEFAYQGRSFFGLEGAGTKNNEPTRFNHLQGRFKQARLCKMQFFDIFRFF